MPLYNVDELLRSSSGRWADLFISAGLPAIVLDGKPHPCPKCGGRDRFAAFPDVHQRGAVHCRHCFTAGCPIVPYNGIATLRWWLGLSYGETLAYLANLLGFPTKVSHPMPHSPSMRHVDSGWTLPGTAAIDLSRESIEAHTEFAREAYQRLDDSLNKRLARHLTVSATALRSLRVGISSDGKCSTWPMRNEHAEVIGVRMIGLPWTDSHGAKFSRRSSQSGIFIPRARTSAPTAARRSERVHQWPHPNPNARDESSDTLYVTEGASDTAAAISLGLRVIGRASCNTSTAFIDRFIHRVMPSRLVLIADHDDAGYMGAKRLAKNLCRKLPRSLTRVMLIMPPEPGDDLRDWITKGANENDIRSAVPKATYTAVEQLSFSF